MEKLFAVNEYQDCRCNGQVTHTNGWVTIEGTSQSANNAPSQPEDDRQAGDE